VVLSRIGGPDPDAVADSTTPVDDAIDDVRIREHVKQLLARCSEEERAMIHALYDEGLSMSELGERMGRNKSTVSRRHAALLHRLSRELSARLE